MLQNLKNPNSLRKSFNLDQYLSEKITTKDSKKDNNFVDVCFIEPTSVVISHYF